MLVNAMLIKKHVLSTVKEKFEESLGTVLQYPTAKNILSSVE